MSIIQLSSSVKSNESMAKIGALNFFKEMRSLGFLSTNDLKKNIRLTSWFLQSENRMMSKLGKLYLQHVFEPFKIFAPNVSFRKAPPKNSARSHYGFGRFFIDDFQKPLTMLRIARLCFGIYDYAIMNERASQLMSDLFFQRNANRADANCPGYLVTRGLSIVDFVNRTKDKVYPNTNKNFNQFLHDFLYTYSNKPSIIIDPLFVPSVFEDFKLFMTDLYGILRLLHSYHSILQHHYLGVANAA